MERREVKRLKFWLAAGLLALAVGLTALFGFASELGIDPEALRALVWKYGFVILAPKVAPTLIILFYWRRLWRYVRRSSKSAE